MNVPVDKNWYHGVVFREGTDKVLWQCTHRHATIDGAVECAEEKREADRDAVERRYPGRLEVFEKEER